MLKNKRESQKKRACSFCLRVFVAFLGFFASCKVSIRILACRESSKVRFILALSTGFALVIALALCRALGFLAKSDRWR